MKYCLVFLALLIVLARQSTMARVACAVTSATIGLTLLCTFFICHKPHIKKRMFCGICYSFSVLLACALCISAFTCNTDKVRSLVGNEELLQVRVISTETSRSFSGVYGVELESDEIPKAKALLYCDYDCAFIMGDVLTGSFKVASFEENIYGYPEADYQLSRGYSVKLISEEDNLTLASHREDMSFIFYRARTSLANTLERNLSYESAALAKCLLLGQREELSTALSRDFTALGLSHMLAISGMHLTVIFALIYFILGLFKLHLYPRNIISIAVLVIFMALTGFPSSLCRAGLTMIILLLCPFIGRRPDSASALCLAVSIVCLIDPLSVYDMGLQLSFLAALGIITVPPLAKKKLAQLKRMPKWLGSLLLALFVTAMALTFTLPLSIYSFTTFSFAGFFTTILFTPFLTVLLYLAPAVIVMADLPVLGELVCTSFEITASTLTDLAALVAPSLPLTLSTHYPFMPILLFLFCAALITILLICPKRPLIYLAPLLCFTVAAGALSTAYSLNDTSAYINISQESGGDLLCIKSEGESVVLDFTNGSYNNLLAAVYTVNTVHCNTDIHSYILTDYNEGTAAYLTRVLDSIYVKKLYIPYERVTKTQLQATEDIADRYKLTLVTYLENETFSILGVNYTLNEPLYTHSSAKKVESMKIDTQKRTVYYLGASYAATGASYPQADAIILGSYGPEYKEYFRCPEGICYICPEAEKYCNSHTFTVYGARTQVILNND